MDRFERKDFSNTVLKDLEKKKAQSDLIKKIKSLESSEQYKKEILLKERKKDIDIYLSNIRRVYPTPKLYKLAPLDLKKRRVSAQKEVNDIQRALDDDNCVYKRLKKLKAQLRNISEDTRAKYFIDVSKGYLSRESFIEIWEKANLMYEEAMLNYE